MKMSEAKWQYTQDMHTWGDSVREATLDLSLLTPDGSGFYLVVDASSLSFDSEHEIDEFAKLLKGHLKYAGLVKNEE